MQIGGLEQSNVQGGYQCACGESISEANQLHYHAKQCKVMQGEGYDKLVDCLKSIEHQGGNHSGEQKQKALSQIFQVMVGVGLENSSVILSNNSMQIDSHPKF